MSDLSIIVKAKHPQYQNIPDNELDNLIVRKYPQYSSMANFSAGKSLGGFAKNIFKSGASNISNIGSALLHPVSTLKNIGKTALGGIQKLIPGQQPQEEYANALGDFYKQRYGGVRNIGETLYNDPVGSALDASVVLGGAGVGLKGLGKLGQSSGLARTGTMLSRAGTAIDPFTYFGKGARALTKGPMDEISKKLNVRSMRASPSQQAGFKSKVGTDMGTFMKQEGIYGGAGKVSNIIDDIIKPIQKQYNALVRTGKPVNPQIFSDLLFDEAVKIVKSDFSTEAQAVANQLVDAAILFEQRAGKGNIPIDIITKSKGSAFGKVPKGALANPTTMHAGLTKGRVGIKTLEKLAPGSASLGKKLQGLQELKTIAGKQKGLGKGTQVFNLFKPTAGGATTVGFLGGLAGFNPILSAGVGATGALLANSPRMQSFLSRGFNTGSKLFSNPKLNRTISDIYKTSKNLRVINPKTNKPKKQQPLILNKKQTQSYNPSISQQIKKPQVDYSKLSFSSRFKL